MFEERRKSSFLKGFMVALLTSLVIGGGVFFFASSYSGGDSLDTMPLETKMQAPSTPDAQQRAVEAQTPEALPAPHAVEGVAQMVAKSASNGVVGLAVLKVDGRSIFDREAQEQWGAGSGFIVSPDGYIITNHHVAGGKNKRIIVTLADGRNLDGVTQWSDPVLDLAVVKVNGENLPTVPLGDSDAVQVGEPAVAIGNPLGLQFQRTVTKGIVSALNRTIQIETEQGTNYMEDLIQTDASINPGNSGGPLFNSEGKVIGINTVKVASAESMGFAIPINVTKPIIEKFAGNGEFEETYMGVFAYDQEVVPYIDAELKSDQGIYVVKVDEQSPAYQSGIRLGCIIKQVDGKDIHTMMQLRTYLYSKKPGDTIQVTHLAGDGKTVTVPVTLCCKEKDGLVTR